MASNASLCMTEELKMFRNVPLDELLKWATSGGAKALGIDSWAGSFAIGKRPGVTLTDGIDWENMRLLPSARSKKIM